MEEEKIEPLNILKKPRNSQNEKNKSSKSIIVGISIIILIVFIALVVIIIIIYNKNNIEEDNKQEINIFPDNIETSLLMYGIKYSNITYAEDNIIINSFKINSDNYKKELGDINNGSDYNETNRNNYTLFIPYLSTKNKDKYKSIILFIHGELWIKGNKEFIEPLADIYAQNGYITAVMDYTFLSDDYKEYNFSIFRILDEINSCVKAIKYKLKDEGFDENKLEIALGGYSAGAYLALLYSYSMNNTPLPIKFIINISGPVTVEPKFWKKTNETLENIELDDIKNAINENKIIDIVDDEYFLLNIMNIFLGKKYNKEELKRMLNNKKIKEDDEKYKELLNIVKYAFPVEYIKNNNNTIPILCIYGGNDSIIGVKHYAYLKSVLIKTNEIYLIYSRYSDHIVINYKTENDINAMREMHFQILNFSKLYFNSYL